MEAERAAGPAQAAPVVQAIEIEGLVRRYGERLALDRVALALEPGRTLTLFGPNGAGKTTLLRVLATLLHPHSGDVQIFGSSLPADAYAVRARVGLLAHGPLLYRDLSGRENLLFYARLYGVRDADERIEALLEACAMTARADDPVGDLSHGMAKRLALCRATLHSPDLLLLDEPHAGLDPNAERLVEPLLDPPECARVLVTHDVDRGLAEADRVIGLRAGRVVLEGEATSISREDVVAIYGGSRP